MRTFSFQTRLWLGHVIVLAVMLALAAFGADWALRRMVLGRVIDDALVSLAWTEATALQRDPAQALRGHEAAPGAGPPSFVRLDKFIQIVDLDGRVLARSPTLGTARLPTPPMLLSRLRTGETVFGTLTDFGDEPVRMVAVPVDAGSTRYAVQVAMSLDDTYAILKGSRLLFLGMSLVILGGIAVTGIVLARRALRPIDDVVSQARRIGDANLAHRLPHPGTADGMARLVETLNDMLERLQRSFEVQRRFTADASHELRSPLSRLRAELEVTLRRPRTEAEYAETLRSCLEEVERVQALIEELLELARLDARQEAEPAEPVGVQEIVDAAVTAVKPEADRRRVAIGVAGLPELRVSAAPGAAKVALANILDNAVKFSPRDARITIAVTSHRGEAVIAVSDSGPGVTPDEMTRVFERFYRGYASRAGDVPGFGLGLAISRALVEHHGGRISVEAPGGHGATFRVHLPRA